IDPAVGPDARGSHFHGVARADDVEAPGLPRADAWLREREAGKLESQSAGPDCVRVLAGRSSPHEKIRAAFFPNGTFDAVVESERPGHVFDRPETPDHAHAPASRLHLCST